MWIVEGTKPLHRSSIVSDRSIFYGVRQEGKYECVANVNGK